MGSCFESQSFIQRQLSYLYGFHSLSQHTFLVFDRKPFLNLSLLNQLCHYYYRSAPLITFNLPNPLRKAIAKMNFFVFSCWIYNISKMQIQEGDKSEPFDPALSHKIDMFCLAILFVGLFSCLIRPDFNFPIVFFLYFVWQERKNRLTLQIMMAGLLLLLLSDLVFVFTEIRVWTQEDRGNPVWQTVRPLHNFAIFCFAVINLLKICLLIFVSKGISLTSKSVQPR